MRLCSPRVWGYVQPDYEFFFATRLWGCVQRMRLCSTYEVVFIQTMIMCPTRLWGCLRPDYGAVFNETMRLCPTRQCSTRLWGSVRPDNIYKSNRNTLDLLRQPSRHQSQARDIHCHLYAAWDNREALPGSSFEGNCYEMFSGGRGIGCRDLTGT